MQCSVKPPARRLGVRGGAAAGRGERLHRPWLHVRQRIYRAVMCRCDRRILLARRCRQQLHMRALPSPPAPPVHCGLGGVLLECSHRRHPLIQQRVDGAAQRQPQGCNMSTMHVRRSSWCCGGQHCTSHKNTAAAGAAENSTCLLNYMQLQLQRTPCHSIPTMQRSCHEFPAAAATLPDTPALAHAALAQHQQRQLAAAIVAQRVERIEQPILCCCRHLLQAQSACRGGSTSANACSMHGDRHTASSWLYTVHPAAPAVPTCSVLHSRSPSGCGGGAAGPRAPPAPPRPGKLASGM